MTLSQFPRINGGLGQLGVSGAVAAVGPTVLFYDTFTGADGTLIASRSPDVGGPWVALLNPSRGVIISNRARQTDGALAATVLTANLGLSDVKITADMLYTAAALPDSIVSVFVRSNGVVGQITGYQLSLYLNGLYIHERNGGFVQRAFAARTITPNVAVSVTVIASGMSLSITDGTVTASYTTSLFQTNTNHGLIIQKGTMAAGQTPTIDNFKVTG
jgi:hypothetical protein